jgi:GntR family transcriptional regulator
MDELGARAPKYLRIADELRREIKAGNPHEGERLPAETALLERFRVSLPTLRQAVGVLRSEGLVESRHGVGTFVTANRRLQRQSRKRYGRARADRQLLTSHLEHEIIFAGAQTVPSYISDTGAFSEDERVIVRRRLLRDKATKRPTELGASYLPLSNAEGTYLESTDVVPKALFLCVEELTGDQYTRATDHWSDRIATPSESELLELPNMAHVIHLIHVAYGRSGKTLEVSESIWPADRVMFIDEYEIPQAPEDLDNPSEV